jgi:hypothetical protein
MLKAGSPRFYSGPSAKRPFAPQASKKIFPAQFCQSAPGRIWAITARELRFGPWGLDLAGNYGMAIYFPEICCPKAGPGAPWNGVFCFA